ncbi:MbeB family mobilization protein [Enterobacter sp. CPE_E331]|uniref:MbeB family mobilization protein n=1 Tax=Enterobacter sp. CPE_E331 TaxID=3383889 RepID=UPI0039764E5A
MSSLLTLAKDLEQKSKAQQLHTGEMLKAAFSEHEQSVRAELSASAKRISDAIRAHEEGMSSAIEKNRRSDAADGRPDMAHHPDDLGAADRNERGRAVVAGPADNRQLHGHSPAGGYAEETHRPDVGVRYQESSDGRKFLILPPGMQSEAIPYDGTTWIRLKQE